MAKGIDAACDKIIALVRATTPTRDADHPFVFDESADGRVRVLELLAPFRTRACDLRITALPRDQGESGASGVRRMVELALRILYDVSGDLAAAERRASEDVTAILEALRVPAAWDYASTGILSVFSPEEDAVEVEVLANADGADLLARIVSIPLVLIYREA